MHVAQICVQLVCYQNRVRTMKTTNEKEGRKKATMCGLHQTWKFFHSSSSNHRLPISIDDSFVDYIMKYSLDLMRPYREPRTKWSYHKIARRSENHVNPRDCWLTVHFSHTIQMGLYVIGAVHILLPFGPVSIRGYGAYSAHGCFGIDVYSYALHRATKT